VRKSYIWIVVALLWVVALLNYVDRQVIFSVLPLVASDLHIPENQLGLLSGAFLWIYGIASPLAGFLADRFGRRRVILASLLIWSAVTYATGLARSFPEVLAARALMGVSEACYLPAALALIATFHPSATRSLATGLHLSGVYVGIVLGGVGGGWAGQHFGWRAPFAFLGLLGVVYCCVLWFSLREPRTPNAPVSETRSVGLAAALQELLRLPGFLRMTVAFAGMSIANWLVYTWMPFYLYQRFGLSLAEAGFQGAFYIQAASFAGIMVGGWLADRWSRTNSRGRILTQVAGLLGAAPFLFLAASTTTHWILIAALISYGIGRGFYDCNAMPVLCQFARSEQRSTGYGLFNLAGCLAGGTAAALAGFLKSAIGLDGAFRVAAVVVLACGLLLARLRCCTPVAEEP
jgi:MFS transporter, Spinster family, sphingosine-1-phosphate transporter